MAGRAVRRLAYAVLPVLYVLHNDLWFWNDGSRFLGLPVGLAYHLLFSAAVVMAMWWLVRTAWPGTELERLATGTGTEDPAGGGPGGPGPSEGSE